jgi:hypothetical protein
MFHLIIQKMATCGYLCPICEGRGFKEDGSECDWCTVKPMNKGEMTESEKEKKEKELQEWIEKVHQGPCCSDPGDCLNQDLRD